MTATTSISTTVACTCTHRRSHLPSISGAVQFAPCRAPSPTRVSRSHRGQTPPAEHQKHHNTTTTTTVRELQRAKTAAVLPFVRCDRADWDRFDGRPRCRRLCRRWPPVYWAHCSTGDPVPTTSMTAHAHMGLVVLHWHLRVQYCGLVITCSQHLYGPASTDRMLVHSRNQPPSVNPRSDAIVRFAYVTSATR